MTIKRLLRKVFRPTAVRVDRLDDVIDLIEKRMHRIELDAHFMSRENGRLRCEIASLRSKARQ